MKARKWDDAVERGEEELDPIHIFKGESCNDSNLVYSDEEEEDEEEAKDNVETTNKMVIVKVKKGENGGKDEEMCMKIERDIHLRWLMSKYSDKLGLCYFDVKFMFNGACIRDTDTPRQLSMIDNDVLFVFPRPILQDEDVKKRTGTAVCYETLCIRLHKKRDVLLRIIRTQPLVRQLNRHFSNGGAGKHALQYIAYSGLKLTEEHTVEQLGLEDGDIIDAFDFADSSSTLSIITPDSPRINFKVKTLTGQVHSLSATGRTSMARVVERYTKLILPYPLDKLVFLLDGHRLRLDQTVGAQLVDGCEVAVILNLRGPGMI